MRLALGHGLKMRSSLHFVEHLNIAERNQALAAMQATCAPLWHGLVHVLHHHKVASLEVELNVIIYKHQHEQDNMRSVLLSLCAYLERRLCRARGQ